jgi:short-subunit dehydrogenase
VASVLVAGASAGIGRATADRLSQAGWKVFGTSRREVTGVEWQWLRMDVDDDESVRGAMRSIAETAPLDAVVVAAGWGLAGPVEATPVAEAKAQLETNFFGPVRVVQQVLPAMRERGAGRVVLVSSIGGAIAIPFQAFYSASKFALEGYGEALAYEVAPFGIKVTLVEPGNVATDFTDSRRFVEGVAAGPYGEATKKAVELMERDERNGVPSGSVAAVIEKTLNARRPPRRVSVGRANERVGLIAKRLMPFALFERAAKGSLGV